MLQNKKMMLLDSVIFLVLTDFDAIKRGCSRNVTVAVAVVWRWCGGSGGGGGGVAVAVVWR
jgi:hypothetical protein